MPMFFLQKLIHLISRDDFFGKIFFKFFPNQILSHCTCHDHMYVRLALGFLQHYNDNNFSCSTLLAFATLGILSQNYILLTDGR